MKSWRVVAVLLLCLVLAGATACNPFAANEPETNQQLFEVVTGDLTVSVSGSGNIAVSNEARLTFGTGGRIDKIFINEGDEIAEGEVLAKLDTAPLELALTQAQVALAQAQIARSQAQIAQVQAPVALTQAQAALAQAQTARNQAQIALNMAEDNLEDADDLLRRLRRFRVTGITMERAESQFEAAELQFEAAEFQLEAAELQLEAAGSQIEIAESQLKLAEPQLEAADLQLEAAGQALEETQRQLDGAGITAPFDGAVVNVGVDEGDTVSTATTIVHLIDPTSMELKIAVWERDIPMIRLSQRAIMEVDALPDVQLKGWVTSISLLPTVEAGVILYKVTIGFDVPQGLVLKVGMSAEADIIIDERSNVLLVPNRAIKQDGQGNQIVEVIVEAMVNEQIQQRLVIKRLVVTGISDGFETEIVEGLSEGEMVVVER